jgi:hypothetical protein
MQNNTNFNDNFLQTYRFLTDTKAEEVVIRIFAENKGEAIRQVLQHLRYNGMELPVDILPYYIVDYLQVTEKIPTWADKKLIQKSVQFFETNIENIMTLLGVYSLPYCYAAADGARVLMFSQQIITNTRKRLAETGQFVLEVMHPLAFEKEGKCIRSIQKVRLMHAIVRYQIEKSNKWDTKSWGKPINQEDMAGTNLAFSLIILRGLRKIGVLVTAAEVEAFLHHWAVIGAMLGLDEKLLVFTEKNADLLCQNIEDRGFRKSEVGTTLMQALLDALLHTPPYNLLKGFASTYIRYVVGDKVADILNIKEADWTSSFIPALKLRNTYRNFVPFSEREIKKNVADFTEIVMKQSQDTSFVNTFADKK